MSKEVKRLVFIISSSIAGGGQIYLYNIVKSLKDNYSVLLICPSGYLYDRAKALSNVDVIGLNIDYSHLKTLKHILQNEIDKYGHIGVNAHLLGTGLWTKMAISGMPGVRFVVTLHNKVIYNDISWYKKFLYPLFIKYISNSNCSFVAVSQEIADSVVKYTGKTCDYIPSSVPIECPPKIIDPKYLRRNVLIGFVGRLSKLKNPIRFVEMAKLVKENAPFARFVMIGDGEDREMVEQAIYDNGMSQDIEMKGFVINPGPEMRKLDVLVISSDSEGTPLVLLESMSYGIPTVSTRVGAIPLVISDGIDGILCDCSASSLAGGVLDLISNIDLYKSVSINGFKRIEETFNYQRNIEQYLRLLL